MKSFWFSVSIMRRTFPTHTDHNKLVPLIIKLIVSVLLLEYIMSTLTYKRTFWTTNSRMLERDRTRLSVNWTIIYNYIKQTTWFYSAITASRRIKIIQCLIIFRGELSPQWMKSITLNFLLTGHTKFSPDRLFGVLKHAFLRSIIDCYNDFENCVKHLSPNGFNEAINGKHVQYRVWDTFFRETYRKLPGKWNELSNEYRTLAVINFQWNYFVYRNN